MKTAYVAYFVDDNRNETIVVGQELLRSDMDSVALRATFKAKEVTHVNVTGHDGAWGDNQGGLQTVEEFLEWVENCE